MLETIPDALQKHIDRYTSLQIGGKSIVCPYYINTKVVTGNLRVMSGKGSPEEIELETSVWAKVKGFDLDNSDEKAIRKFMMDMKIGIDCSGFMAQIINSYMTQVGHGKLISNLKFNNNNLAMKIRRFLRPIENIGANTLTSSQNTSIVALNDIKPGDLIRAKGSQKNSHHVAMIVGVERGDSGNIRSFAYVNSHRFYEDQNGVRYGKVIITDINKGLKDQVWQDVLNDRNYFIEDLLVDYEDNGIRRLNFAFV